MKINAYDTVLGPIFRQNRAKDAARHRAIAFSADFPRVGEPKMHTRFDRPFSGKVV